MGPTLSRALNIESGPVGFGVSVAPSEILLTDISLLLGADRSVLEVNTS